MSILSRYILKKYLFNFIIVLVSLELFFVGIDFLQNFKHLPSSANLQLLYLLYNSFFTLTLALPLSLVFAWILTLVLFIRSNEFVAFNALGSKPYKIYFPIVLAAFTFISILVSLQFTPLAYSYEQKKKILDGEYFSSKKEDIFLKYNNNYIYFKKFFPLEKKARNIHIYKISNNKDIIQTIIAKDAYFKDDKWYITDARIVNKPEKMDLNTSKLNIQYKKTLTTLEGFKPKILDNVYETKSHFSILDAISALILLSDQGIHTEKIRSILYNQLLIPFFIIPLLFLIFAYATLNSRFFNMGKFVSLSIFSTLVVWGLFFMLFKFTNGGIVSPEVSIVLPLFLWFIISYFIFIKKVD